MGSARAWAALRYDERRKANKEKIHRLEREEGLQVWIRSPRKRAGVSSIPPIEADDPNVVWAIDFQSDSTIDCKAIKIASMVDEHTRCSLLNIVERWITAELLVDELKKVFAVAGGPPTVLRMDNGPEFYFSSAAMVLRSSSRYVLYAAGHAVEQRAHRII
ncbi:integrase catalytic domain-containing protein [Mycobacterium mantenii]|nr:DDE-type integrase/transposase/recombinase [Mycobacterium mantenii]